MKVNLKEEKKEKKKKKGMEFPLFGRLKEERPKE